jgi:hypothetical protein
MRVSGFTPKRDAPEDHSGTVREGDAKSSARYCFRSPPVSSASNIARRLLTTRCGPSGAQEADVRLAPETTQSSRHQSS